MSEITKKLSGKAGFLEYYQKMFATDNRDEFKQFVVSLEQDSLPIFRTSQNNRYTVEQLWKQHELPFETLPWNDLAIRWPRGIKKGTPLPGVAEHLIYPMNASSLLPVMALQPQPGETVLDACAAPGGKALYIADTIHAAGSASTDDDHFFVVNDTSQKRRRRLRHVMNDYGHPDVQVLGTKAETVFKQYSEHFDRILVDAPCSSEKHVYTSPQYLEEWSTNRIKSLAQRQIAILSGLVLALKPGGRLVYSTCAINTVENEGVVARILQKKNKKQPTIKLLNFSEVLAKSGINAREQPGSNGIASTMGSYKTEFDLNAVRRIIPHRETDTQLDPMFVAVFEKL